MPATKCPLILTTTNFGSDVLNDSSDFGIIPLNACQSKYPGSARLLAQKEFYSFFGSNSPP